MKQKHTVRYRCVDCDEETIHERLSSFPVKPGDSAWVLGDAAQECAEHYYVRHDGWECTWPLTFALVDETGREFARYNVGVDMHPVFSATADDDFEPQLQTEAIAHG